jgi:hypothetical protein
MKLSQWPTKLQFNKPTKILIKLSKILFIAIPVRNYNLPNNSQHILNAQSSWSDKSSSPAGESRQQLTQYGIWVYATNHHMIQPIQPAEGWQNVLHIPNRNPCTMQLQTYYKKVSWKCTFVFLKIKYTEESDQIWRDRQWILISTNWTGRQYPLICIFLTAEVDQTFFKVFIFWRTELLFIIHVCN